MDITLLLNGTFNQPIKVFPSYVQIVNVSCSYFSYLTRQEIVVAPISITSNQIHNVVIFSSLFQNDKSSSSGALYVQSSPKQMLQTFIEKNSFQNIYSSNSLIYYSSGYKNDFNNNQIHYCADLNGHFLNFGTTNTSMTYCNYTQPGSIIQFININEASLDFCIFSDILIQNYSELFYSCGKAKILNSVFQVLFDLTGFMYSTTKEERIMKNCEFIEISVLYPGNWSTFFQNLELIDCSILNDASEINSLSNIITIKPDLTQYNVNFEPIKFFENQVVNYHKTESRIDLNTAYLSSCSISDCQFLHLISNQAGGAIKIITYECFVETHTTIFNNISCSSYFVKAPVLHDCCI